MTRRGWKALGVVTCMMGGAGLPRSAEACSGPVCDSGGSIPTSASAEVPASLPALVIVPPIFQTLDAGSVHLRTAEGADVAATVSQGAHGSAVVVPTAPLVPGAAYRLEGDSPCPY